MHSLRLDVPDNLFPQIVSYLNQYSSDELYFVEDSKPSFVVNTLDDAKERILRAEKNNTYIEHNDFWNEIDEYTQSL